MKSAPAEQRCVEAAIEFAVAPCPSLPARTDRGAAAPQSRAARRAGAQSAPRREEAEPVAGWKKPPRMPILATRAPPTRQKEPKSPPIGTGASSLLALHLRRRPLALGEIGVEPRAADASASRSGRRRGSNPRSASRCSEKGMHCMKRKPSCCSTVASMSTGRSTWCGSANRYSRATRLAPAELQHRQIGRSARIDRAVRLDLLAAEQDQLVVANRHRLGAEPILVRPKRLAHEPVHVAGADRRRSAPSASGSVRKGKVIAGPAMRDERLDRAPALLVHLVFEEAPEPVGTAERLRFLDQQDRDSGRGAPWRRLQGSRTGRRRRSAIRPSCPLFMASLTTASCSQLRLLMKVEEASFWHASRRRSRKNRG
jgi:hypothetical protein